MMRPLRDFIVVRPFKRSLSEIIETPPVVGIDRGRPNMDGRAIVLCVGPGRRNRRKGWYNPLEVVPGDLIAFEDHKAYPRDPTEPDLLIMQGADCVVIDDPKREDWHTSVAEMTALAPSRKWSESNANT